VFPRAATSCAVWLASILPLAIPGSEHWLSGVARTGLVCVPWLVYSGLPIAKKIDARDQRGTWAFIALALPPLALAVRIDLASGFDGVSLAILAAGTILCAVLLRSAAVSWAREERGIRMYAIAWMTIVIGAPILREALERGGAPSYGAAPAWLAIIARASPLEWLVRETAEIGRLSSESARVPLSSLLWPAGLCAAFLALSRPEIRAPGDVRGESA
jgi:hypothetical protein